ncbi:peptidase C14, caspase catalytic subunit p20 [Fischerella thermalis CCMEE 5268]|uniref:Peptidase C14, caspase catalytic subunit p20 n=1 Tax=Fischerella thermalis CCMEE 5268 TaxID=2019662 RepID=A0A2N6KK96_9CYAN|nr:caspase family protein [Fischerella thermalis]PMB00114.1 peptidase C14, caspase catalytic subunit p20 [Fischerella thermalis CCMEE 5268]
MSYIKRRQFLQFASSAFITIGLSQLDIMQQAGDYAKVLAQNTPRKLALLVGINEYPDDLLLAGCVNDVLLQKELLVHRFGFNEKDILTVTDAQATREGILTAFHEHLIKQAKPGDVVVFHFSGHGSRVADPDRDFPDGLNSTLVPVDSPLPPGYPDTSGTVKDIIGHTLFLLMYALPTENVTVVLDSCHSGGGKRGNFVVRSRDGGESLKPSPVELEYQRQLLSQLNLSPQKFIELRRKAVAKGVVIASAKREQLAVDAKFNDFNAGAFTFLLTQYLWQLPSNESVNKLLINVARNTKNLAQQTGNYQDPEIESNLGKQQANPPIYFTHFSAVPAEAVITQVNGNQVKLWLGGVDSQSLEGYKKGSYLTVLDAQGGERGLVKLDERQGLVGKGKLLTTTRKTIQIQPGNLLQERIRSIPNNLTLKIGLDDSLDSNTTQQAKQALQAVPRIEALLLRQQEVQYIFGRMSKIKYQILQKNHVSNLPVDGSFGLFLPGLSQIIPSSFGNAGESVNDAVKRLQPKLKSLLAARIIKQILGNVNTSLINVTASMTVADKNEILGETFTIRGVKKQPVVVNKFAFTSSVDSVYYIPKLPIKTPIAFQVQNHESTPLYVSIFVIDSNGEISIIFPNTWSAAKDAALVEPKQKLVIPQSNDSFKLTIGEPLGISEALIIASTTPLRESLKSLQTIAQSNNAPDKRSPNAVADDFLELTNNLLADLDAGTRDATNVEGVDLPPGVRGIDAKKLAAMAIAFEVVSA